MERDLVLLCQGFLQFESPQICKHLVIGEILDLLSKHGVDVPDALFDSLVRASRGDAESKALLEQLAETVGETSRTSLEESET